MGGKAYLLMEMSFYLKIRYECLSQEWMCVFHFIYICPAMLSCFNCVQLCVISWAVAHHAPLSMGFSRQEYWSGLPCPPPGDLPNPGIEPGSLISCALASRFFTTSATLTAIGHYFSLLCSIPFVCLYNMVTMEMQCLDLCFKEGLVPSAVTW